MKEKRGEVVERGKERKMTRGKQKENSEGVWEGKEQDKKRRREDAEMGVGDTKGGRRMKDERRMKSEWEGGRRERGLIKSKDRGSAPHRRPAVY